MTKRALIPFTLGFLAAGTLIALPAFQHIKGSQEWHKALREQEDHKLRLLDESAEQFRHQDIVQAIHGQPALTLPDPFIEFSDVSRETPSPDDIRLIWAVDAADNALRRLEAVENRLDALEDGLITCLPLISARFQAIEARLDKSACACPHADRLEPSPR